MYLHVNWEAQVKRANKQISREARDRDPKGHLGQCTSPDLDKDRGPSVPARVWERGIPSPPAAPSDWPTFVKCPEGGPISRWRLQWSQLRCGPGLPFLLLPRPAYVGLPSRERSRAGHPQPYHPATSQGECILGPELVLEIPLRGFDCQLCCLRF